MSPNRFSRRLRMFLAYGPARQALVAEAAVSLLAARLMLLRMPFQRLAARWGDFQPSSAGEVVAPAGPLYQRQTAQAIGWAVRAAASAVPFKAMCLQQAVAARSMLARRGIASVIHYGAGRDGDGALIAHAWLDAAGEEVTGYPVGAMIAEIGAFVPQR